jgi:hypothetical protein
MADEDKKEETPKPEEITKRVADAARRAYETRIGIDPTVDDSARPVSGYLVNRSQDSKRKAMSKSKIPEGMAAPFEMSDGDPFGTDLSVQGEIEIILKPGVAKRTSYTRGDAVSTGGRAVAMNSDQQEDILDAIIHDDGPNAKKTMARTMLGLLKASLDDDYSGVTALPDSKGRLTPVDKDDPSANERKNESYEAMILGGFDAEDVEGIHFPFSKIQKLAEDESLADFVNNNFISSRLKRLNNSAESARIFSSLPSSSEMKTESMIALKEFRAAKRMKKMYGNIGVDYIKISHPQGINIEDPRTYDKNASPLADVESILKAKITKELDAEIQKLFNNKSGSKDKK